MSIKEFIRKFVTSLVRYLSICIFMVLGLNDASIDQVLIVRNILFNLTSQVDKILAYILFGLGSVYALYFIFVEPWLEK